MLLKNTPHRFGWIAMSLHWIIAILIIGLIILGLYMVPLPFSLQKLKLYGWHKEFGILVLMLAIFRLFWRFTNITPLLPEKMHPWEKTAAHAVHWIFYGFMFALPITGWMISSAADLPVPFFGFFLLPNLIGPSEEHRILLAEIHEWLSYGLIFVILGHTAAALQHHFYHKDDILRRMLP